MPHGSARRNLSWEKASGLVWEVFLGREGRSIAAKFMERKVCGAGFALHVFSLARAPPQAHKPHSLQLNLQ